MGDCGKVIIKLKYLQSSRRTTLMYKNPLRDRPVVEILLSVLVLLVLFAFTYAIFVHAPYTGFYMNPQDGRIVGIYVQAPGDGPFLRLNDLILRVRDVRIEEYSVNPRLNLYEGIQAGQVVDILVERDGTELTIPWKLPGFNRDEFNRRFF